MREILFKAKRTDTDTWTEGNLLAFDSRRYIINDTESIYYCPQCDREEMREMWFAVIPETVSQFTGLYDKNGKKIFENGYMIIDNKTYKVIFDNAEYILTNIFDCDIITLKNNSIKGVFVDEI